MKRAVVAAAWVAGATVPLLIATVFVFGCCVLPFHGVIHRVMPLCQMAVNVMSGHHHDGDAPTPMPAREKQEPVKRLITEVPHSFALAASGNQNRIATATARTAYRSFISLGATRCDRDVGLHVLIETFLI